MLINISTLVGFISSRGGIKLKQRLVFIKNIYVVFFVVVVGLLFIGFFKSSIHTCIRIYRPIHVNSIPRPKIRERN